MSSLGYVCTYILTLIVNLYSHFGRHIYYIYVVTKLDLDDKLYQTWRTSPRGPAPTLPLRRALPLPPPPLLHPPPLDNNNEVVQSMTGYASRTPGSHTPLPQYRHRVPWHYTSVALSSSRHHPSRPEEEVP